MRTTETVFSNFHYNTTMRPRKELIGNKRVLTPKFDIEACMDMNGERAFIVRFRGQVVTTIPSQRTRQAARDKAAHYWRLVRNPDKYPHIECPF